MDYNPNPDYSNYIPTPQLERPNGFAIASMVCGILAIVVCCTGILGIPLGALSILFAVLSKRRGRKLPGMSLAGILLSVAGILLGLLMTVYSFYLVFNDPTIKEQTNIMMEELYGVTIDEYFDMLGGN